MSRELDYHYQDLLKDKNEEIENVENKIDELYEIISKYENILMKPMVIIYHLLKKYIKIMYFYVLILTYF